MEKTFIVIFCAITIVGIASLSFQIYQIVKLDAKARGLNNPKLWGALSLANNNGSGFITYMIVRRKYPIINMSATDKLQIAKRKKIAGIALVFLTVGMLGVVIGIALFL